MFHPLSALMAAKQAQRAGAAKTPLSNRSLNCPRKFKIAALLGEVAGDPFSRSYAELTPKESSGTNVIPAPISAHMPEQIV